MAIYLSSTVLYLAAAANGWDITGAVAAVIGTSIVVIAAGLSTVAAARRKRPHYSLVATRAPKEMASYDSPYRTDKKLSLSGAAWQVITVARPTNGLSVERCRVGLVERNKWRRWRWHLAPSQTVGTTSIWSTDKEMLREQERYGARLFPQMRSHRLNNGWMEGKFTDPVSLGGGDEIRFRVGVAAQSDWKGALELQLPDSSGKWRARRIGIEVEHHPDPREREVLASLWPEVFGDGAEPAPTVEDLNQLIEQGHAMVERICGRATADLSLEPSWRERALAVTETIGTPSQLTNFKIAATPKIDVKASGGLLGSDWVRARKIAAEVEVLRDLRDAIESGLRT